MKKILSILLLSVFCFLGIAVASDAQRQISKYISNGTGAVTEVKASAGKVYGVTVLSTTTNGGYVTLYDSTSSTVTGLTPKVEIGEATQYKTAIKDFPEGFDFYNGIYAQVGNAKVFVYYY